VRGVGKRGQRTARMKEGLAMYVARDVMGQRESCSEVYFTLRLIGAEQGKEEMRH